MEFYKDNIEQDKQDFTNASKRRKMNSSDAIQKQSQLSAAKRRKMNSSDAIQKQSQLSAEVGLPIAIVNNCMHGACDCDKNGNSILHVLAAALEADIFQKCLYSLISINYLPSSFVEFSKRGHISVFKYFMDRGGQLTSLNKNNESCLSIVVRAWITNHKHISLHSMYVEIITFLFEKAQPDVRFMTSFFNAFTRRRRSSGSSSAHSYISPSDVFLKMIQDFFPQGISQLLDQTMFGMPIPTTCNASCHSICLCPCGCVVEIMSKLFRNLGLPRTVSTLSLGSSGDGNQNNEILDTAKLMLLNSSMVSSMKIQNFRIIEWLFQNVLFQKPVQQKFCVRRHTAICF